MTVCIAALFRFNYATKGDPPDYGTAALVASDRMITAFDVKYEPPQQKVGILSPRTLITVAGDIAFQSAAISKIGAQFGRDANALPERIASAYGRELQALRLRLLEDQYLAPVGLNTDTFHAQQRELSDSFVSMLVGQMQTHKGPEVEALIVGSNGDRAEIWGVDEYGTVTLFNDIGFAAIGIGGWHAKSSLMQAGYASGVTLAPALAAVLTAKKSAETAPGVSVATDWHLVLKTGFMLSGRT